MFQHALVSASNFFFHLLRRDSQQLLDAASSALTDTPRSLVDEIRPSSQIAALRRLSRQLHLSNRDVEGYLIAASQSTRGTREYERQLPPLGRALEVITRSSQCLKALSHRRAHMPRSVDHVFRDSRPDPLNSTFVVYGMSN